MAPPTAPGTAAAAPKRGAVDDGAVASLAPTAAPKSTAGTPPPREAAKPAPKKPSKGPGAQVVGQRVFSALVDGGETGGTLEQQLDGARNRFMDILHETGDLSKAHQFLVGCFRELNGHRDCPIDLSLPIKDVAHAASALVQGARGDRRTEESKKNKTIAEFIMWGLTLATAIRVVDMTDDTKALVRTLTVKTQKDGALQQLDSLVEQCGSGVRLGEGPLPLNTVFEMIFKGIASKDTNALDLTETLKLSERLEDRVTRQPHKGRAGAFLGFLAIENTCLLNIPTKDDFSRMRPLLEKPLKEQDLGGSFFLELDSKGKKLIPSAGNRRKRTFCCLLAAPLARASTEVLVARGELEDELRGQQDRSTDVLSQRIALGLLHEPASAFDSGERGREFVFLPLNEETVPANVEFALKLLAKGRAKYPAAVEKCAEPEAQEKMVEEAVELDDSDSDDDFGTEPAPKFKADTRAVVVELEDSDGDGDFGMPKADTVSVLEKQFVDENETAESVEATKAPPPKQLAVPEAKVLSDTFGSDATDAFESDALSTLGDASPGENLKKESKTADVDVERRADLEKAVAKQTEAEMEPAPKPKADTVANKASKKPASGSAKDPAAEEKRAASNAATGAASADAYGAGGGGISERTSSVAADADVNGGMELAAKRQLAIQIFSEMEEFQASLREFSQSFS